MAKRPSTTSRRALAAVIVAVLALGLAACGSDDNTTTASTGGTTSQTGDAATGTGFAVVEDGLDADTAAALNAAAEESFAGISSPGAVMAVRTPEGTWIATVGATELGGSEPMTVDVNQRIGSITKTFTVTALLQLADKGELSLDDPISKYVEGTPNPEATLGQLAAMRSGIPSYTFSDEFQERLFTRPTEPWTPEELIGLVEDSEPDFAPGTETSYSNTNTVLLGMVIEKVTGKPLEAVMQEQIIEPLGLDRTLLPTDASFADPHAHGYTTQGQEDGKPADATDWNPSWGWAAGAMISDLDDLLTYGRAMVAGDTLLSPEMQTRRIESFDFSVPPNTPDRAYGLGLGLALGWYGHTGELPGYNTVLQHHLAEDITVVVMVNSDISSGDCPPDAPTMEGGRTDGPCDAPAVHIANALTAALGFPLAAE